MIISTTQSPSWDDIPEEEPDEFDSVMLTEIKNDKECHEFLSEAEVLNELGL